MMTHFNNIYIFYLFKEHMFLTITLDLYRTNALLAMQGCGMKRGPEKQLTL